MVYQVYRKPVEQTGSEENQRVTTLRKTRRFLGGLFGASLDLMGDSNNNGFKERAVNTIEILQAYTSGVLSRSAAMDRLGIAWYGDLVDLLDQHSVARPTVPADVAAAMQWSLDDAFAVPQRGRLDGPPGLMPRFARNDRGRDLVVADVHGEFSLLAEALRTIKFDEERDRLFCLGDAVDRGSESQYVMEWLRQPWFHLIAGNHEVMTWRRALGEPFPGVDHRQHGGAWLDDLTDAHRALIGRTLAELPVAIEVETRDGAVGLVHADCPFDDWGPMHHIRWDEVDPTGPVALGCQWSSERYARRYARPIGSIRAVLHGHVAVTSREILGNVHFIETRGWSRSGYFTFVELESLNELRGPQSVPAVRARRNR